MTLNELESDLYRRLGFTATPDPVVTTRLRAYLNQTQRQILSQKGLHKLRQVVLNATAVAGDPYLGITPASVRVIQLVDRANQRVLVPVPLSHLRATDPGQTSVASIPQCFAVISLSAITPRPTSVVGLSVKSTSAADDTSKSAVVELNLSLNEPLVESVAEAVTLNGTTAVNFTSPWPVGTYVTRFYLRGPAGQQVASAGTITLYQGTGATGTPLAVIRGSAAAKIARLQLYPTPQTAIVYHVDAELSIEDMSSGGEEPLVPEDFHWVLTSGALLKEWQRMEKTAQYDREQTMFREGIGDLKMFVARAAKADGKNGNGNGLHDSSFGPWYPVGGMSTAAPHAPTHEPGGNDPMAVDALPTIGSLRTLGSGPNQAAPGDDPRFTSGGGGPHHLTHESGGSDALSVLLLAGYPGGTTGFLRADATFATPATGGGAHHATHEPGGTDPMAVDALAAVGSLRTLGAGANQAAPGNDARFTAAPQLHAPTHKSGGADAIKLDELAAPTDVTTLNATTGAHGLLRKLSGVATQFLDGSGAFSTPTAGVPGAHATTHQPGGADAMAVDAAAATGSLRTLGTGANQAAPGNDTRFTAAPQAHHASHEPGGGDALANAAWTNVANTFTQDQTISRSVAAITLNATGAIADARRFDIVDLGAGLQFQAKSDAGVTQATPFSISRTGAYVSGNLDVIGTGGNVACKDQANTFTQDQTISKSVPLLNLNATQNIADQRVFRIYGGTQTLIVDAANDALVQQGIPLILNRTGDAQIGRDIYEKGRATAMGHWQAVPFSAANFSAAGGGTWTVGSAAILNNRYTVIGKTLHWQIYVSWFSGSNTVAGTVTGLNIAVPGGFSVQGSTANGIAYTSDAVPWWVSASGGTATVAKVSGAAFTGTTPGFIATMTWEIV